MTVKDEQGPTRVMSLTDFSELAYGRLKIPWKNIVYIQTVVKIKHGIGESMMITYYSHLHTDTGAVEKLKEAGIQKLFAEDKVEFDLSQDIKGKGPSATNLKKID